MQHSGAKNFYEILGVSQNANQTALRRAYRRLCKKYHPDKNPADQLSFQEISLAYRILSDAEQRRDYDDKLYSNIQMIQLRDLVVSTIGLKLHCGREECNKKRAQHGQFFRIPTSYNFNQKMSPTPSRIKIDRCLNCDGTGVMKRKKQGKVTCRHCRGSGRLS